MIIRPLEQDDRAQWLPLWQENCQHLISNDVTLETWRRICATDEQVFALGVFNNHGILCGFLHYILHPTTGFKQSACYMQDLFIAKDYRRQGIAKSLVRELGDIGTAQKWARIYWFAEKDNIATQNLYKNLGIPINFSLHMLQTQE